MNHFPFHLVSVSPWPFIGSIAVFGTTTSGVMYMHRFASSSLLLITSFVLILVVMFVWFKDVVREATYQGEHTKRVQKGLRYGVILFIVSEVMFFFAFFWAFFSASLSPVIEIGSVWPPEGIKVFNPFEVPFLNTVILLLSGASITFAHHAIVHGDRKLSITGLIVTIALAITFTLLQVFEYMDAQFKINDGVYGSTFFMATGFHGFHVLIGSTFLVICLIRLVKFHFTKYHHFGFEAAAWYWHFVDVVWLFLFVSVYFWFG